MMFLIFFYFYSFNYMSGFGFQLLKGTYVFCRRVLEKFLLSFLTSFNGFFLTNTVKPMYFLEFVFRNVGFQNILVCNLDQSIRKLSHWILRQYKSHMHACTHTHTHTHTHTQTCTCTCTHTHTLPEQNKNDTA